MGKFISPWAGGRKGEEGDVQFLDGAQRFLAIFRLCVHLYCFLHAFRGLGADDKGAPSCLDRGCFAST